MTVTVRYLGVLGRIVGIGEESVHIPDGSSLRDLLNKICRIHGSPFRHRLLDDDGRLSDSTVLIIDGSWCRSLDISLASGTETVVALLSPVVAGG